MKSTLRLFNVDGHTYLELDGKSMGAGVVAVKFEHDARKHGLTAKANHGVKNAPGPHLELTLDLSEFKFQEDGHFDGVVKKYAEYEPPKAEDLERLK